MSRKLMVPLPVVLIQWPHLCKYVQPPHLTLLEFEWGDLRVEGMCGWGRRGFFFVHEEMWKFVVAEGACCILLQKVGAWGVWCVFVGAG